MCIMYVVVTPCVLSLTCPVCHMETSWRKSQTLADCTTEALCSNEKRCIQALDTYSNKKKESENSVKNHFSNACVGLQFDWLV